jgi:nucleoside-diphosphate-sugar epimerase
MSISLEGRRVAIIGGAGFIGHHLALALASKGAKPYVLDSLQVNNLLSFAAPDTEVQNRELYERIIYQRLDSLRAAGIPLLVVDARDYQVLSRMLGAIDPQTIVHLAAVSHAGRSNKDPYSTFDHSLRTLENALDHGRYHCEHFVYLSSSMVYGNFLTAEVDEEHPLNPMGIYGALKVAGEKMVLAHQQVFGMNCTIVRPSALYGPRCVSRRVGQVFIENAMNQATLRIDGDGSEKLDFTYVEDLVEGICLVMQKPESRKQIFNLTYGSSRSIQELLTIVKQHFPEVKVESIERDKLMPVRGTLSVKKARELLGYEPQNPIEVGFPKYIQWYRDLMRQLQPEPVLPVPPRLRIAG